MQDISNEIFIISEESGSLFTISHTGNPNNLSGSTLDRHLHHWAKKNLPAGKRYNFLSGSEIPSGGFYGLEYDFSSPDGYATGSDFTQSYNDWMEGY